MDLSSRKFQQIRPTCRNARTTSTRPSWPNRRSDMTVSGDPIFLHSPYQFFHLHPCCVMSEKSVVRPSVSLGAIHEEQLSSYSSSFFVEEQKRRNRCVRATCGGCSELKERGNFSLPSKPGIGRIFRSDFYRIGISGRRKTTDERMTMGQAENSSVCSWKRKS